MQKSTYERFIDVGSGNAATSITINGSTACGNGYTVRYRNSYGYSPWDLSISQNVTTISNVTPGVSYDISSLGKRYLLVSIVMDDSSCTNFGISKITDINVNYITPPNAPTLAYPLNGSGDVSLKPEFSLAATASYVSYFQYKIDICSTSNCSVVLRTIDQTTSQSGWLGQSQQSNTAYYGGLSIVEYAIHRYQDPSLSVNTQYWWRGYAVAPAVGGAFSVPSNIYTFTTRSSQNDVQLNGGVNITSGSNISP